MPKNIVICCDGTGNEVEGNLSNVLKLYRIAQKNNEQTIYYDPGIGTIGQSNEWGRIKQSIKSVFGLATGYGLDSDILDAYRFVCEKYEEGDRLFLFGFSRGAYAVRALAGFIHLVGLLRPDQLNVAGYALTSYKRSSELNDLHIGWNFRRIIGGRHATVHFLGVWDTVASVLVPRPDRLFIPSLRTLPYTRNNPSVRCIRHAIAIDERRRMFRLNNWVSGQRFVLEPFAESGTHAPQDNIQMCFSGVHSDIGGGYSEDESSLSKFPLGWLVDEAAKQGFLFDKPMYDYLVDGKPVVGGRHSYVPPNPGGKIHNSLTPGWWPLEWIPKRIKWLESRRFSILGWYLPIGEPRRLPDDAVIHPSVGQRIAICKDYKPVNLPPNISN
jgi:uncharacterized protein (DUF2235 family)